MDSSPRNNLRLGEGEPALPFSDLRREVRSACLRLAEVQAALRLGRVIDAHEGLTDVLADLRAELNEPA